MRVLLASLTLILFCGATNAQVPPPPDRSILWTSEEAQGRVLPSELLRSWPRDTVYGYDVDHVHLDAAFDMTASTIEATGTLTVTVTEAGLLELPVDLDGALTVDSASIDGVSRPYTRTPNQVILSLATPSVIGAQLDLAVAYHGRPAEVGNKSMRFRVWYGVPLAYTLSTPYSTSTSTVIPISHYWRPCKDVPDDKSTFSCNLTVPVAMTACSNGVRVADTDNGDGTRTVSWVHGYPVAPYLITVGVTDYDTIEDTYTGPEGSAAIQHFIFPNTYNQLWRTGT